MATHIINADPAAIRTVEIPGARSLQSVSPTIAIGEILQISVRQNPADAQSQGLIAFRGQIVPALLPENVQAGDQLLAKVMEATDAIILKILDIQTPQIIKATQATQGMSQMLREFIQSTGPQGLRTPPPILLQELGKEYGLSDKQLTTIFSHLAQDESFEDPAQLSTFLEQSADGKLADVFRNSAQLIRDIVQNLPQSSPDRVLTALHDQLTSLLDRGNADPETLQRSLGRLITLLQDDVEKNHVGARAEVIRSLLPQLRSALENPQAAQQILTPMAEQLQALFGNALSTAISAQAREGLEQLAQRLEQFAALQEKLSQLNPIMQSLGEPALILFPFILHGLLNHSEVAIHPDDRGKKRKQQGSHRGTEDGSDEGANDAKPFQRVQVSVPLPSLGTVHVDVAHRGEELFARFTVEDAEVGAFLLEQLEHLVTTLRESGFTKAELVTQVGKPQESLSEWPFQLSTIQGRVA